MSLLERLAELRRALLTTDTELRHLRETLSEIKQEVSKVTTAAPVGDNPEPGPIILQDHGHQVRFRNIWFVPAK